MTSDLLKSFNENYNELVHKFDDKKITRENIASYIDHTLLKPEATIGDIKNYVMRQRSINLKRYV